MIARINDRVKFALERFILGGALNRLLVIAVLLVLLALAGGTLIYLYDIYRPVEGVDSFPQALWWAVQRLSDTGPAGTDQGAFVRVVALTITVLGVVLFLGGLVAIMTQWLNFTMSWLQGGYTPLALNNHVLILGWSSRTVAIVQELLLSEGRVKRFLLGLGAERLRVVILAEEVVPQMIQDLKDRLGKMWNPKQIILRTGSPLRLEHLRRADFLHAGAILLPAADSAAGEIEYPDARTVKTILATGKSSREGGATDMPLMVAELGDARKLTIARAAYGGPIEVVASDLVMGRLLAQNIRHPGISHVYNEMLHYGPGSEFYLREFAEIEGRLAAELIPMFPRAIPVGIIRGERESCEADLNPRGDVEIRRGDRLVLLARSFSETEPVLPPPKREAGGTVARAAAPIRRTPQLEHSSRRRVLVLGWNHVAPALIRELESYHTETFEIDLLSLVPGDERRAELARLDAVPRRSTVRLLEGEYTSLTDLSELNLRSYHNVVILSTDRLESEGERDARSILGSLVLKQALGDAPNPPHVLVELLDAENVALVRDAGDETILRPAVMSHILTQVALHRDLRVVYDVLFGPEGAEIFFRPAAHYGLIGESLAFEEVQRAAAVHAEVALGLRLAGRAGHGDGGVVLNPDRALRWTLSEDDAVVVLTEY